MDRINANLVGEVNASRGAPMGRCNHTRDADRKTPRRFYLRRVRLDSGGYDAGGAYWGIGAPLYAAFSDTATTGEEISAAVMYMRAPSRDAAKRAVLLEFPAAVFFDGPRGPVVPDGRYRIMREWCGYETPRYVARFCNEWLGQSETLEGAERIAAEHRADFLARG